MMLLFNAVEQESITQLSKKTKTHHRISSMGVTKRICEVYRLSETRSHYVNTVSFYDFRIVYVVLHLTVKEFFKTTC